MSLEITILGPDGAPAHWVAVRPDDYFHLMQQVRALSLPLLSRLSDYYGDVEYTPGEMLLLRAEADTLLVQRGGSPEIRPLIEQIQALLDIAIRDSTNIMALAD